MTSSEIPDLFHIICTTFTNNGTIRDTGGLGGSSGYFEEDDEFFFVSSGFGKNGHEGILRVDGQVRGNYPELTHFYNGPGFTNGGMLANQRPTAVFLGDFILPWVQGGNYY